MKTSILKLAILRALKIINGSTFFESINLNSNLNYYLDATINKARSFNDYELAYAIMTILDDDGYGVPNRPILLAKKALDEDDRVKQLFAKYGQKFKSFIFYPQLNKIANYLSELLIGDEDELNQMFGHIPGWYQFTNNVSEFIGLVDDIRFRMLRTTKSYSYA